MRISDWSSDVCSSDLADEVGPAQCRQDRDDHLVLGLRLVETDVIAQLGNQSADGFTECKELGFGIHPATCVADAFAQEVAGEKQAVHSHPSPVSGDGSGWTAPIVIRNCIDRKSTRMNSSH